MRASTRLLQKPDLMDLLLFALAALLVGAILWLGATGRIGTGKPPMNAADPDAHSWTTQSGAYDDH